jgi:uncharacterized protein YfdQ (DUF2303 family)
VSNTPEPINNAAVIIAVAREAEANKGPRSINFDDGKFLLLPNGSLVAMEKHQSYPRRKRATVGLYEARSFIDYVNLHKHPGATAVFGKATELGGSFTAVLDYHGANLNVPQEGEKPGQFNEGIPNWGDHKVTFTLETTPEWARWVANSNKLMPQEQFAEFIEENMADIVAPAAGDILDMAQGLVGRKGVQFKTGRNLKDGSIKLEYVENIDVQGTISRRDDAFKVPDSFRLGIVPFVGSNGVEIDARLRFRIGTDAKLSFAYLLNRPYRLIEEAFNATRDDIERETGIKVMLGSATVHQPN